MRRVLGIGLIYFQSAALFIWGIARNGLRETNSRLKQIETQGNFWFPLCKKLAEEIALAREKGDAQKVLELLPRFKSALNRFESEVASPLRKIGK